MTPSRLSVWPPLPLGAYGRPPRETLPFPLDEPTCRVFARARHGLWQGVQALTLGAGDEVLVPAYHHGSEVEALVQAGLEIRFYEGTETLEPDEEELDRLLGPRGRALYITHYLGFPQDVERWRTWCDSRNLVLIEDAAQAWLASVAGAPVGTAGDLAVFCLYKTIGVPDGAAMVVRAPAPGPESARPLGLPGLARRHAVWLVGRHAAMAALASRLDSAATPYDPESDFALGDAGCPASAATVFLLARLADDAAAAQRRANYSLLLDELETFAPEPFSALPPGAAPFAFPVLADRKESLLARLDAHGIAALDFWAVPHASLPEARFPRTAERRRRTVALPVHQELRLEDLERIVAAVRERRPPRRRFELESMDALDPLDGTWDELAEASGNVFASWEWVSTWWSHFGADKPLMITKCIAPGGRLLAILPLYRFAAHPLSVVRFVGHGPADQLGPICAAEDRALAARALRRAVHEARPDVFLAEQLPGNEGWNAWLGGTVVRREGNPVLRLAAGGWDEYLAARSANFRQQVRRLERKLVREHGLRYRLTEDRATLADDLDTLFALHAARWGDGASAFSGSQRAFHRDFAVRAFERGWLRLWFLEADGRPVAAWHGFRFAGTESYYQAGRDPSWQGPSVGFVLLAHTVRAAFEDGMREYRFLRGGEAFKYRFADDDTGLETVGVPHGGRGRAALVSSTALPGHVVLSLLRRLAA